MNLFKRFQALIPSDPLMIVEVKGISGDGTSTVETPTGAQFRVRGDSVTIGNKAFVQGGRITDEAPSLPLFNETI